MFGEYFSPKLGTIILHLDGIGVDGSAQWILNSNLMLFVILLLIGTFFLTVLATKIFFDKFIFTLYL